MSLFYAIVIVGKPSSKGTTDSKWTLFLFLKVQCRQIPVHKNVSEVFFSMKGLRGSECESKFEWANLKYEDGFCNFFVQ